MGTVTEVVTRVEDNGDVVDQSPDYGVHLRRNDSVDLVIARAPKRGEGTPVPDLIGRDLEQAKKVLGWAGLRLGAVRQKDSEDHVPGMVLRQDPAPSSRVENGERVDIVVARTPEKPRHRTEVPNLRGLGVKAAKRALRRADLRLGEVRERWVDHGARDGRVIGQYPEPSSRMRPGERVDIVVARRAEDERARSTTVPSVIGLPLERARRELTQAGLRLGRVTEDITENTWGETIIAQRPAAFWDVATGTVVDVVVARAPKPEAKRRLRTVPPLAGLSVAEADQRLRHAGLRLGRTTFARQGGEVYQIIDQSPAAGAQVKARTKVAVVVVEPRD